MFIFEYHKNLKITISHREFYSVFLKKIYNVSGRFIIKGYSNIENKHGPITGFHPIILATCIKYEMKKPKPVAIEIQKPAA